MKRRNKILSPQMYVFDVGTVYEIGGRKLRYVKMHTGDYMFRDENDQSVRVTKQDLASLRYPRSN